MHGPLCRVVELAVRDDVAGAVITDMGAAGVAGSGAPARGRAMSAEYEQPAVVEGELVDVDALLQEKPLQYTPAVREARHITTHRRTCACGKGSPEAHGAIGGRRPFSCGEILEIAARVEAGRRHAARWLWLLPVRGRHVTYGGHDGRRWS